MPYFGTRVKHADTYFTIRLHGPLDKYHINFVELKQRVSELIEKYKEGTVIGVVNQLALDLKEIYCNGNELLWVQIEALSDNQDLYGNSAERIIQT